MKINYLSIIIISLFLFSCKKTSNKIDIENKIVILGHGGMGIAQTYPQDTYESIIKCLAIGADGTEIDVQLTKDSVLIAYHDTELSERTISSGLIHDMNWDELENVFYTNTANLNYSVLSLDDLFSNIDNLHDYKFTFDCKLNTNTTDSKTYQKKFAVAIDSIVSKFNLIDNLYIESENETFLNIMQKSNPKYKIFIYPKNFEDGLSSALKNKYTGITISTNKITKQQLEIAHSNNLMVAIWNTHTEKENDEAVLKNPDFIQTDKVKYLVKRLRK